MRQPACLMMAGGRGERFWPASRSHRPKQLLRFGMKDPLVVQTLRRIGPLVSPARTLVITSAPLVESIAACLPELKPEQILGEPVGRNTAPCIGVAAVWMAQHFSPDCVMIVLSADHYVARRDAFLDALRTGTEAAAQGHLVTLGLNPTRAETGYGYVELGRPLDEEAGLYRVARFLEKPDAITAQKFLAAGKYLWNGGIFLWTCARILEEMERHLPSIMPLLKEYQEALKGGRPGQVLERIYPQFPDISIDYAVMEKAEDIVTLKANIGWDDLGNWTVLERLRQPDSEGNVVLGPFVGEDTRGCIISADAGLVATLGVKNLVVVKDGDVVLVMPKDRAAELKQLIGRLKEEPSWEKFL